MNKKIFFLLSVIFLLSFASATFSCEDFTSKNELCKALNYSSLDCDNWWWNNASDCTENRTSTFSFNESNFYSREQVDSLFSNFSSILNISNGTIIVQIPNQSIIGYVTEEKFEKICDKIDEIEDRLKKLEVKND